MARRDPWYRQAADYVLEGSDKDGVQDPLARSLACCACTARLPTALALLTSRVGVAGS